MFPCMPCLKPGGAMSDLTSNMKYMSLKVMKVQKHFKRRRQKGKGGADDDGRSGGGKSYVYEDEEEEEEEREWVAEEEPGVLLTFVSVPHGSNLIKKLQFSKEYFPNDEAAENWWKNNCDRIESLHNVQYPKLPSTAIQSDEESQHSSSLESGENPVDNINRFHSAFATNTGTSTREAPGSSCGREAVEWVVEDQPGVFVTIRCTPDGIKEIMTVQLSRDYFGDVKAKVWWTENRERLQQQYSNTRSSGLNIF